MTSAYNTIYYRRKRSLPVYSELFKVLLKIPDTEVRDRVTDAINGVTMCSVCKKKDTREFGTQTENITDTKESIILNENEDSDKCEDKPKQKFVKKRRKRKRTCPQVVKTAQIPNSTPILKQDKVRCTPNEIPAKVMRADSELSLDINFELMSNDSDNSDYIQNKMKIEFETRLKFKGGLLPIHEAIEKNDIKKLRRQIYVWNFLKANLMELLTEDDYNVIQLAVIENSYKCIIEELLKQETIHLNDIDYECNTIIHLAVTHLSCDDEHKPESMLKTLELLLRKFDLDKLREKNNEGMTALHLAVREGKYLMVETILNVIDDMLHIKSVDPYNKIPSNKEDFKKHYSKQCDNFEGREQHELKSNILDATDMKSGCTALYFAMEKKYDHIIYLLLAHMSDPTIKNLAGVDPKTYYSDYGCNAGIAGAVDQVIQVLKKPKNS